MRAGVSFRGAAASLALMVERLHLNLHVPSFSAIRSWIIRLGCFALSCDLPQTSWVYLIDHSVQIGSQKLLVILGCPVEKVPFGERPLQHRDLTLVHLALMDHSNSQTVAHELDKACERTGIPEQVISDEGSDLKGGVRIFQDRHSDRTIAYVNDLAHVAANVLKARRSEDSQWSEFASKMAHAGSQLRQTSEGYLRPPSLRPKARFMNVAPMVRFANRVLKLLDTGKSSARTENAFGWLRDFREALGDWTSEQWVVEAALRHVRTHGLNEKTVHGVKLACGSGPITDAGEEVARILCARLKEQSSQAKAGGSLVGSTEVVESVFGKLKRLENSYSGDGFTDLSLAVGALVGEWPLEKIQEALEEMPVKESESRFRKFFRSGFQRFRRLFGKDPEAVPNLG